MSGAKPLYLSAALILEEGFPLATTLARDKSVLRHLARQFAAGLVEKQYLAVVIGRHQVVPLLEKGKQLLFSNGDVLVGGLSLVLAACQYPPGLLDHSVGAEQDPTLASPAEASLARVRALLARAETISDVVALEGELARRQSDLEALQARQRVLDDAAVQTHHAGSRIDLIADVDRSRSERTFQRMPVRRVRRKIATRSGRYFPAAVVAHASSACFKSAIKSSEFSIPQDMRIMLSEIPNAFRSSGEQ